MNLFGVIVIVHSLVLCYGHPLENTQNLRFVRETPPHLRDSIMRYRLKNFPVQQQQAQVIDFPGSGSGPASVPTPAPAPVEAPAPAPIPAPIPASQNNYQQQQYQQYQPNQQFQQNHQYQNHQQNHQQNQQYQQFQPIQMTQPIQMFQQIPAHQHQTHHQPHHQAHHFGHPTVKAAPIHINTTPLPIIVDEPVQVEEEVPAPIPAPAEIPVQAPIHAVRQPSRRVHVRPQHQQQQQQSHYQPQAQAQPEELPEQQQEQEEQQFQHQRHHQAQPQQHQPQQHQPQQHQRQHHHQQQKQKQQQSSASNRFQLKGQDIVDDDILPEHVAQPIEETEEDRLLREEQARSAHYSFGTSIDDRINDHSITRQETRDGLALKGMYSYSDGFFKRTIHYEADENGYRVVKEEIEPIGDGPQYDPNGTADISANVHNQQLDYSITADDFVRERPNKTAIATGRKSF